MLDDLTVLQAEEVRRSCAAVFRRGLQQAVRHNQVALGNGALDVETQLGELLHEVRDKLNERQLPPGLQLTASPGRTTGTPTTRGTFSFVVRVTDSRGAFAERTFSINVT